MEENQRIANRALELLGDIPEKIKDISGYDDITQKAMLRLLACELIEGSFTMTISIPSFQVQYKIKFNLYGEKAVRKLAKEIAERGENILPYCSIENKHLWVISISNILAWKLTEYGVKKQNELLEARKVIESYADETHPSTWHPDKLDISHANFVISYCGEWSDEKIPRLTNGVELLGVDSDKMYFHDRNSDIDRAEIFRSELYALIAARLCDPKNEDYQINKIKFGEHVLLIDSGIREPREGHYKIIDFKSNDVSKEIELPQLSPREKNENLGKVIKFIGDKLKSIPLGRVHLLGEKSRKVGSSSGRPRGKKNSRLTQKQVGTLFGVNAKTISRIENKHITDKETAKSAQIAEWYYKGLREDPINLFHKLIIYNKYRINKAQHMIISKVLATDDRERIMEILNLENDYKIY